MQKISSNELSALPTLIREFMTDRSTTLKTFADLQGIFDACYVTYEPDASNDKRILVFEADMKSGKWTEPVIISWEQNRGMVTDGIHRGIAYLRAVAAGATESNLPDLILREA